MCDAGVQGDGPLLSEAATGFDSSVLCLEPASTFRNAS